ncbi:hypothetical protein AURDEDRAFT_176478 [Auricularia subglabra TFB-10046 SS5]|uniref:Uncharacterized protein n=1 Tax=Auricularia subglabra (strain TFB-10046 / SS5) TaxID=717982 RepID=J0LD74_AURST|nr:hypothetical protein AURDEDRAFT_176478 [Auricularia subglabra TFB-10046 SS5]
MDARPESTAVNPPDPTTVQGKPAFHPQKRGREELGSADINTNAAGFLTEGSHSDRPSKQARTVGAAPDAGGDSVLQLPQSPKADVSSAQLGRIIPKPAGQVTRLREGGYTLISALRWDPEQYKRVQGVVHGLAVAHLDTAKSYARQESGKVALVCQLVSPKDFIAAFMT